MTPGRPSSGTGPRRGDGIVVAFRRPLAPQAAIEVKLGGIGARSGLRGEFRGLRRHGRAERPRARRRA
ncbi:MAG: hypothetical protein MZU84_08195 [Sphingobacterium sp.]|nr:hypothetical protein [Sphingobacterium sp.]